MNKTSILIVMMLFAAQTVAAVYEQESAASGFTSSYGDVYVTQLRYDPYPASPGTYIDVWYKVENRGDVALDNVAFILQPESPFSLDVDEDATHVIGTLTPREAVVVKFKVRISEDALQGDQSLTYTWRSALYQDNPSFASTISIRSTDALLVVSSVRADPEQIAPGASSTVTLSLTNVGDAFIRYVTVRMGLFKDDAGETLPFSPVGSGTSASIVNIAPGESQSLSFTLAADPD
ncbi:MAG: hypothetical protein AABY13_05280, partial [Nanoarchaeota archaeon]